MSRPFASAFLAGEAAARPFLPDDFRDRERRAARTRTAAARPVSPALLAVLREQQGLLAPSAARDAHLAALAAGGAAVVATGQQVGLFLGPLYGFYKAASAVAVARALTVETGVRCVPLFWLQTEDHDFAEIATATVADRAGAPCRFTLADDGADRVSIAHRRLGPDVAALVDGIAAALPPGPAADDTVALLRAHYRPGRPLAAAFAELLAALFADDGLLIFDARDARVAALAAPVYRRAADGADAIEAALRERGDALAAAGFDAQIPVRERCALLFFHRGDAAGPRYRLRRGGARDSWALAGAGDDVVPDDALAATIEADPLRVSTSALLRPIVQDTFWPTAAYVAGPGEVSYFAQLAPVYDQFGLAPPLVVPRARFRCLDARTRRLLAELGLAADEVTQARAVLAARMPAPSGAPDPAAVRARLAEHAAAIGALASSLEAATPGLARAAARTRGSVARAVTRLGDRYARALLERDAVARERLERLEAALLPGGVPQERAYAWPSLAGRVGPAALKRLVMDSLTAEPFATHLRDLEP